MRSCYCLTRRGKCYVLKFAGRQSSWGYTRRFGKARVPSIIHQTLIIFSRNYASSQHELPQTRRAHSDFIQHNFPVEVAGDQLVALYQGWVMFHTHMSTPMKGTYIPTYLEPRG